jgi:hypothetical protein
LSALGPLGLYLLGLWALDRVFVALERHGLVYWRGVSSGRR